MKLRVVELLLVTTVPALFLATNGIPDLSLTFWSLLGGTLAAGGANAFNMVIESDTDKLMKRTANRPIATGQISKTNALLFSSVISIASLVIFYVFTTELATLLTALAIIFYIFGYTIALKRHTSQNIVWGGIAGCMPVLIGQAAVTNSLTATSWLFFLLIFFWTPPHFWALAVRYKDDYAAAGIVLGIEPGSYSHHVGSLHIYEENYDAAAALRKTNNIAEVPSITGRTWREVESSALIALQATSDAKLLNRLSPNERWYAEAMIKAIEKNKGK